MQRDSALPTPAAEALDLLYQHRLLSTPQLHELLAVRYAERSVVRLLDRLRERGLAASVQTRTETWRRGHRLWFLTEPGAEVVESVPDRAETRRRMLTAAVAAGQLQAHTLAVNDVGIAFMRAARQRNHDFGPYSWRHEVAHDVGRRGRGQVIADSVLRYWMPLPSGRIAVRYRFVELDRANRLVDDVAAKLARYALLREVWAERRAAGRDSPDEAPGWPMLYRHFPSIIVVLANAGRANLQRRLANLLALSRADPELGSPDGVSVSFVFFEELMARGPFAPIFWRLEGERPVNWLGQEGDQVLTDGRSEVSAG
jgi:hypothetical protein